MLENVLLIAGTHDISLILSTLQQLSQFSLQNNELNSILIPKYEKSLNNGKGNRLPKNQWNIINNKPNIVLFEGWMLGFNSISNNSKEYSLLSNEMKVNNFNISFIFL